VHRALDASDCGCAAQHVVVTGSVSCSTACYCASNGSIVGYLLGIHPFVQQSKGWGVEPLRHSSARLAPSSAALRLSLKWVNMIASMLCRCEFKKPKSLCILEFKKRGLLCNNKVRRWVSVSPKRLLEKLGHVQVQWLCTGLDWTYHRWVGRENQYHVMGLSICPVFPATASLSTRATPHSETDERTQEQPHTRTAK
jgi:hypothetical protein